MPTTVRSFSKINLGLAIGPLRQDGFHGLTTLYQTLAAHDCLTLRAEPLAGGETSRIVLRSNHPRVPLDARNTVWKMLARALAAEPFRSRAWAVEVEIDKRLPIQGGLGAGSANAAAALVALERELGPGFRMTGAERLRLAASVGSDVPLFLIGGAVLGMGRGEQVYPMPDLVTSEGTGGAASEEGPGEVVLAFPEVGVSTPLAFRDWDKSVAEQALAPGHALTPPGSDDRLGELSRALAAALCEPQTSSGVFQEDLARDSLSALVRTGIRNDFEAVVFRQHPFLGTIKQALLGMSGLDPRGCRDSVDFRATGETVGSAGGFADAGALYAALSGSGSALFGLYGGALAAERAEARLERIGVRSLRTRLLSRASYWRQTFVPGYSS